jgi:poly-gamma-glutamate capsule biosynthesis protein CapA/YwtB (metallophosphatase superfamily)
MRQDPAMHRLVRPVLGAALVAAVATSVVLAGARTGHAAPAKTVTLEWVGDTVLGSAYGLPPDGGRESLAAVTPSLRLADLTWGNLEETLSSGGTSKCAGSSSSNCFAFQAPPSYARLLARAGFDVMNLANNHAYDFGASGLRQTHAALGRAHVRWTGGPAQITVARANGIRVAFLGFAPYPWAARLDRIAAAQRLVRKAAGRSDLVVVAIHAGAEGAGATHVPRGTEYFLGENRGNSRRFTHAVIDAGADLVVGSGPHVIRGVEWYHRRLIAYSAGNFAGYHNFGLGGTLSLSAIVRVTLQANGSFVKGRWISLRLGGPGLPRLDPSKGSLHLVVSLSHQDFGGHAARFTADGQIRPG